MKYIKKFNEDLDEKSIVDWCKKLRLSNYTINNEDNTVDVSVLVDISHNELERIPIQFGIVNEDFYCSDNQLTSLLGSPRKAYKDFICCDNKLITLVDGPTKIGSIDRVYTIYNCRRNNLISLEGIPKEFNGGVFCEINTIYGLYKLFRDYKSYVDSLDYNYFRGTNIIKLRFQEALDEAGMKMPESIPGYKYI